MSVDLHMKLPRKLYEILLKKAQDKGITINDLIILAIERILSE